ncbi:division/cell wall cluster transcriptional repressor MraZ [Hyphococcus sp.]|uniref:division/cell wall cluster transcriptional repressor MraZ n=1 Tax=Hyphococcus sp. TaxID=2038636 RepID=UPI00208507BC|nr:MAG: transcriptional regulator MraZ [Marinicaulis sp.]
MRRGAGARFFGSYVNKIDAKGRLATPAAFRRALDLATENVIYCLPSTNEPCLECGGADYIDYLLSMIEDLDPYSEKRIALERAMATQMSPISTDTEGRINLPEELRKHAQLNGQALFAGHIRSFQIWNPELFTAPLDEAKKIASEAKRSLRNPAQNGGAE